MSYNEEINGFVENNTFWTQIVTKKARKLKKQNSENPFLSHDEKSKLFIDWKKNGDLKSRDKLLDSLYPLALQLVNKLILKTGSNKVDVKDLQQEANLALVHVLDESDYNPDLGTLPTYFRSRLPMYFYRALKDYGNFIRIPDNILKDLSAESKAFDEFVKNNGRYPEVGEVVTYKNKEFIFGEKNRIYNIVSGNNTVGEEGEDSVELFDLISDEQEQNFELVDKNQILNNIVDSLSKREKEVINYAFYTNIDISEIIFLLKPYNQQDKKRLYKRAENIIKIETDEGVICYKFYVHRYAKHKKTEEVKNDVIRPISHIYIENHQANNCLELTFGARNIKSVYLNNKDISDCLEVVENNSFNQLNTDDTLYQIKTDLKVGTVYSFQTYNKLIKNIKDKIRKKIVKYEIFK
jgi:RNA polymerase sigma factor (sigma-70 family)